MSEYPYTTGDLAGQFDVTPKTIRRRAASLGIGIDFEGRAGWRYSEADRQKLIDSMRPVEKPAPRKRRRAA